MLNESDKLREVTVQELLDYLRLENKRLFPQRHDEPIALYLKHLASLRDEINNHAICLDRFCPGQVTVEELLLSVQRKQGDVLLNSSEPSTRFYRLWLVKLEMDIFGLAETIAGHIEAAVVMYSKVKTKEDD